jgi:peptidoglycan DL-endopeptidase RipA
MPRRVRFIVFLGVITMLVLATGISAGAEPGDVQSREAEIAAAQERLFEIRTEQSAAEAAYSDALFRMNELNVKIAEADEDLGAAEDQLAEAQEDLENRASEVYRSGNVAFINVLVGVDNFSQFATRLDLWMRLLGEEKAEVEAVLEAKNDLEARKSALETERARRVEAVEEALAHKERAAAAEAEAEAYLNSLNGELQGAIQAEQERQAAAARAAAAEAAAAEAAAAAAKEAPKPEAPKPEAPKPEAPKPEAPKPEAPKLEAPEPDLEAQQQAVDEAAAAFAAEQRAQLAAEQAAAAERRAEEKAEREALKAERLAERKAKREAAKEAAELAAIEAAAAEQARAEELAAKRAAERRAEIRAARQAELQAELQAEREAKREALKAERLAERKAKREALKAERLAERKAKREAAKEAAELAAMEDVASASASSSASASASASAVASAPAARSGGGGNTSGGNTSGGNASGNGNAVVAEGQKYLGVDYQLGACDPAFAMDCSCFTMLVYAEFGISLPDNPAAQWSYGTPVKGAPAAGDLLFWAEGGGRITHVGIAMGDGTTIHASVYEDEVVQGTPINAIPGYVGARRLL